MTRLLVIAVAVIVSALAPRAASHAQAASGGGRSTATMTSTNYLGIENFQCDCTLTSGDRPGSRRFLFRSEPVVLGVRRGGPSYGILERGDVITHVDGRSIRSAEGGRRFAAVVPGNDVELTVRRDGRPFKAVIHAGEAPFVYSFPDGSGYGIGWQEPPTPAVPPEPPTPSARSRVLPGVTPHVGAVVPVQPALPAHPSPGAVGAVGAVPGAVGYGYSVATPPTPAIAARPLGWFGFSIRCNRCGWSTNSSDDSPVWESETSPELSRVDPESPAGRAGLRAGDRITHIDGHSILSRLGARRFGSVRPGQRVRLTVQRGTSTLERELTLGTRPEARAAIAERAPRPPRAPSSPTARRELRYTGQIDNVFVEVWSPGGPTVDRIGDTMVITVGTSVVRIKVDPKK